MPFSFLPACLTDLAVAAEVHLDDFAFGAEGERLRTAGLPLEGVEGPVEVGGACNRFGIQLAAWVGSVATSRFTLHLNQPNLITIGIQ